MNIGFLLQEVNHVSAKVTEEFVDPTVKVCPECLKEEKLEIMEYDNSLDEYECPECQYNFSFWSEQNV